MVRLIMKITSNIIIGILLAAISINAYADNSAGSFMTLGAGARAGCMGVSVQTGRRRAGWSSGALLVQPTVPRAKLMRAECVVTPVTLPTPSGLDSDELSDTCGPVGYTFQVTVSPTKALQ